MGDRRSPLRLSAVVVSCFWSLSDGVQVDDHIVNSNFHDSFAIEEEEWEWEHLPGRCCYDVGRPTCNGCRYWGNVDDFCHKSKEFCTDNCSPREEGEAGVYDENGNRAQGDVLPLTYCEGPTPPLVDGGKVCTGASRINEPCYDGLNTGKCLGFGLLACQTHCRWTQGCALFVVYSDMGQGDNMDGSCVLCYDLHENEPTTDYRTRTFRFTENQFGLPPMPPAIPGPRPPPRPPNPSPPPLPELVLPPVGDRVAACTFHAPYDLVYESDSTAEPTGQLSAAAADMAANAENALARAHVDSAANATMCCAQCAADETCDGFVFEESSGVCVSLPAVTNETLVPRYNRGTTAGFVQRLEYTHSSISPPPAPPPAQCTYVADKAYSASGASSLGRGAPPHGVLMTTQAVCCGACAANPECAKFSWAPRTWPTVGGECLLFRDTAEAFNRAGDGLVAGTIDERDVAHSFHSPPPPWPPTAPFDNAISQTAVVTLKPKLEDDYLFLEEGVGEGEAPPDEMPVGMIAGGALGLVVACIALRCYLCCSRATVHGPKFDRIAAHDEMGDDEDAESGHLARNGSRRWPDDLDDEPARDPKSKASAGRGGSISELRSARRPSAPAPKPRPKPNPKPGRPQC